MVSIFPISPFHPTLDPESENSVLPYSYESFTKSSTEVPLMAGFCDKEAAMAFTSELIFQIIRSKFKFITHVCRLDPVKKSTAKNFYTTIRQNYWGWGRDLNDEQLKQIQRQIEDYYLDGKPVDNAPYSIKCNVSKSQSQVRNQSFKTITISNKSGNFRFKIGIFQILTDIALSDVYDTLINPITTNQSSPAYVYRFEFEGSADTMKNALLKVMDEPIEGIFYYLKCVLKCDFLMLNSNTQELLTDAITVIGA